MTSIPREVILEQARETLRVESEAVADLIPRLDEHFVEAVELLLAMTGRVIVTGIGKSGAVGRKLASTLASTGTPAHFMHAAEAIHGDLGMITDADVVIMITNSGETAEIVGILPVIKRRGAKLIAICGNENSTVGQAVDVSLDASVECEACPLGLAPTSSALAELALGDALAMAVMRARGFTMEDYGETHPGGSLGKRVLLRVEDLVHGGEDNPTVSVDATVEEAVLTMSTAVVRGAVSIVDDEGKLHGLFTDGDFRMLMSRGEDRNAIMSRPIVEVMTAEPTIARTGMLAVEALRVMDEREFDNIPVVDDEGRVVGILDVQDLMKAGIV